MTIMLLLASLSGTGCAETRAQDASPSKTRISIMDGLDRAVTLERPAARIASLSPGMTESLFAIGCGDRVVVRDRWSDFPAAAARLPAVEGVNPSADAVALYRPDLIILYFSDDRHAAAFEVLGIPVAIFDPRNYDQVASDIEKVGVLCGQPERAAEVARTMRGRRDAVRQQAVGTAPLRVYVEVDGADDARPWTAGPGSFVNELIETSGAVNVFSSLARPFGQVSLEEILRARPDVILLAGIAGDPQAARERLYRRPAFSLLAAVKKGRIIHRIDKDRLTRTGPRLADGLEELAASLHRMDRHP
jgi:iron complex transport system substrate-binding protein